ncbi:hypothetical protein TSOC_006679 [Tetrabaena socialis]|uniref:Uncharacterized protein n=1 Tax=Tetrabaena socialis TaxID=47790 RepID=A0A2J8A316_9CHLO|nr:hypothetical protein TSOC_006679 [Tetrabaena socialis]|eukprot:PNH06909.1 hypothetical protein TSOC_006679 [Tetrabaena socialis]
MVCIRRGSGRGVAGEREPEQGTERERIGAHAAVNLSYVCVKERNLLLTEMAWKQVPKDADAQRALGIPIGDDRAEGDVHRMRYSEVQCSLRHIRKVLRERAEAEAVPRRRAEMRAVIDAK